MTSTAEAAAALVREALGVYADDAAARPLLEQYARRLEEPLRVAVAGKVKAGKSTLLNAVIGEEIAPTDTGECTRVVTWYRYARTPRVTLHPHDGDPRPLPVRRVDGRLRLDLGGTPAEDVARLVVDWPSARLRDLTLIDTPGIASLSQDVSARTTAFLTPEDTPSQADAVVYLLRHLHASDVRFLESFRDTVAARSGTVNVLGVLSRADEIGAGRIDALLSARDIARRYREDGTLRTLALDVVPIAGLLAQSARTLRESEYAALRRLAALDRAARERMLVSADRFTRPDSPLDLPEEARAALVERFGLFGIRLAVALLRGGIADSTALAHELARRSGLEELVRLLAVQFEARAAALKARTVLLGVERLVRERPRPGAEPLLGGLERIAAGAHEFRELRLLAAVRTEGLAVPPELAREAERLLGARGTDPAHRLGLPDGAGPEQVRDAARAALARWRTVGESPLTTRATAEACQVLVRSCEALLAGATPRARLVLGPEPGADLGQARGDERRAG
ncbi:dynamin family protein [Georgenia sp. AZ-5]|uniref:dynamin family protein n=1 Tax=Georgenia sp. AZ-5 TaxID=3367526 RepID=UPI003754EC3E